MLSREDGFPVVEAVYNGEDYWNQGEAGNVLVTGGSSNSENGGGGIQYKSSVR